MPTKPPESIKILEKDLKPLLASSPPITFHIRQSDTGGFFIEFTHQKKKYIPITVRGHVRIFLDVSRLITWAESIGVARVILDVTFDSSSTKT